MEDGPSGLIAAIRAALGPEGAPVMPSMTDDDDPTFNVRLTPCLGMGVLANTFWQQSGVLRSDSPHAFAAAGPQAAEITAPHPVDIPQPGQPGWAGLQRRAGAAAGSRAGRQHNHPPGGKHGRGALPAQKHLMVLRDGQITRLDYAEIDHCCQNFSLVDGWLDARGLQRRGTVGRGKHA